MLQNTVTEKNKRIYLYAFLIGYTCLLMFFCTKSSPLYVLNDWYDANAYFTMGKGMMNGAVPYKDLFDHKGPLLYLLYGIGYLIDYTGFIGIFLIQIIFMSLTVVFSYKIVKQYVSHCFHAVIISMLVPIITLSRNIYVVHTNCGGGSPDEFVTALLVISLYVIIKFFHDKEGTQYTHAGLYMFIIGLMSGFTFLLKFNFILFFVGLIVPIYIYLLVKHVKTFAKSLLFIILGCISAVLPYIVYALVTNSFRDFIAVYLKFNLSYSGGTDTNFLYSLTAGVANAVQAILYDYLVYGVIIVFGLLYFIYKNRQEFILYLSVFLGFVLMMIAISVKPFMYVYIPISAFSIFGLIAIYRIALQFINRRKGQQASDLKYKKRYVLTGFTICIIFVFTIGNNGLIAKPVNRATSVNPKPFQNEISDMILADTKENHSVLEVLTLDCGVYTALGLVPQSRYFYLPNVVYEQYPDVFLGQYNDIVEKKNAYLVCTFMASYHENVDQLSMDEDNYLAKFNNAILENYSLVNIVEGTYLQEGITYYLYKRI